MKRETLKNLLKDCVKMNTFENFCCKVLKKIYHYNIMDFERRTTEACHIPTEEELLSGVFHEEININELVAGDIVILYLANHPFEQPFMRCIGILRNDNNLNGRLRYIFLNNNSRAIILKTHALNNGFRFFKYDPRKPFDKVIDEYNTIKRNMDPMTIREDIFSNLGNNIGNYLGPKSKKGGKTKSKKGGKTKRNKRKSRKTL